jgi:hypothetical protein
MKKLFGLGGHTIGDTNGKRIQAVVLAAILILAVFKATAATVQFTSGTENVTPLSQFVMSLEGIGFPADTISGDVTVNWDPTVLNYVSTSISTPPWFADGIGSSIDDSSQAAGILDLITVTTGGQEGPIFPVVDITFDVIGAAGESTAVTPSIGLVGWFNISGGGGAIPGVDYVSSTVNVVPVPASVWLFGSALGLLGWIRRRNSAKTLLLN